MDMDMLMALQEEERLSHQRSRLPHRAAGAKRKQSSMEAEFHPRKKPAGAGGSTPAELQSARGGITEGPNATLVGSRGPRLRVDCALHPNLPFPKVKKFDWQPTKEITIGSDFAGINSPIVALKLLGIPFSEIFSCDNDPTCQRMLLYHFPETRIFYGDIAKRDHDLVPRVDVYLSTLPCQPFSTAGKMLGVEDARGTLFYHSLAYVKVATPRLLIFENISSLIKLFNALYNELCDLIGNLGMSSSRRTTPSWTRSTMASPSPDQEWPWCAFGRSSRAGTSSRCH